MINYGSLNEPQFLQLIESIQKLMNLYEQKMKDQHKILIIVGITGAGKSTIFNFLCGGNYTWQEIKNGSQLILKENSDQFAMMNRGMNSVTKEPKYYVNEKYNHLIIDFPGFKDPNGELDQILIQMLFQKIVSKSKVKLIYVVRHPETRFNERGVGLQDFIKLLFQTQQVDLDKICLLLNCYGDKLSDQALKESVKKQLQVIFKSDFNQISVLRKCKSSLDVQQIFSDEKRDQLMVELTQTQDIQFNPKFLEHSEKITQYLSEKNFQIYNRICEKLNKKCQEIINKLEEKQLLILKNLFEKLVDLFSDKNSNIDTQYSNFITLSQQIADQLQCQNEIGSISHEYSIIFNFFSQFQDLIAGYQNCLINQSLAKRLCNSNLEIINQQILLLYEKKHLIQAENEKQNAIYEKEQAEYQVQIEQQLAFAAQSSLQKERNYKDKTQKELNTLQCLKQNQQGVVYNLDKQYQNLQYASYNDQVRQINQQKQLIADNQYNQHSLNQTNLEIQYSQQQFDEIQRQYLTRYQVSLDQNQQLQKHAENQAQQLRNVNEKIQNEINSRRFY